MLEITWLGHSSFQLRLDSGEILLLDPWPGNPRFPAGFEFTGACGILVSHGHFDHIAGAAELSDRFQAPVVGIYEVCGYLKSRGAARIAPMNKGGSQMVGPVRVTMTHAVHSSGIEDENGNVVYGGEPAGFVLGLPDGRNVYFAGDTAVFSDMALIGELYRPNLAILPIGDLFTMGTREAALACRMLKAADVIPMHWGTFPALTGRPEELSAAIADLSGTKVLALEPGVPLEW